MTAEPGKLVGGKYRLEKPLARGGMGSVWLARHAELDAPVAVKFMAHELVGTAAAEARFKREAKAAAQLRSPHVVHIHDYGVEDGAPFMVMELLEGEDLAGAIARAGRLPIGRVAAILTQVAKALAMAHAAGIVHRDLKPSNLFLARAGEDEIVKVLDFGVAKETLPTLVVDKTTSGVLIGSPQYMSPEQARGEAVDLRSDLWSLGVVAYEALTGVPPFESTHLGALLAKINEATPAAPTSLVPALPEAADELFRKALARRPEDRFPSAKAFADALSAIASPAEPGARPAPTPVTIVPANPAAVSARSAVARDSDTLPATAEPAPVSSTMPEQPLPKDDASPKPRRAPIAIAAAAALGALAVALWLGVGPGGATGAGVDPGTGASSTLPAGLSGASTGSGGPEAGGSPAPSRSVQNPAGVPDAPSDLEDPIRGGGPAPSHSVQNPAGVPDAPSDLEDPIRGGGPAPSHSVQNPAGVPGAPSHSGQNSAGVPSAPSDLGDPIRGGGPAPGHSVQNPAGVPGAPSHLGGKSAGVPGAPTGSAKPPAGSTTPPAPTYDPVFGLPAQKP